jgi:hypothetical protein
MNYTARLRALIGVFDQGSGTIYVPGGTRRIVNLPFSSENCSVLPGEGEYRCTSHYLSFVEQAGTRGGESSLDRILHREDSLIGENHSFAYTLFTDGSDERTHAVIILFHGLNERSWDKYLPWADALLERTGKTVLLFPLAFHMNRAPAEWSAPRAMQTVSRERKRLFPALVDSTFANAAISTRLQVLPQRFFWSGVQTYYDFLQLVRNIRKDRHPLIAGDATIDFFGYSIGAFLSEIFFMIDPGHELSDSRLFIFCGGPTFDRMSPVSKFIIDSLASVSLYSFFVENFEGELRQNERLAHYFGDQHPEGFYFKSMLSFHRMRDFREKRLHEIADRVAALSLRRDTVIYPDEVANTLKGSGRSIPLRTEVMDFPYPYTHENPFPLLAGHGDEVDRCFDEVFDQASGFLR